MFGDLTPEKVEAMSLEAREEALQEYFDIQKEWN